MKYLVPNLLAAMERAGMNQADLAKATGWSTAKVSRIAKSKRGGVKVAELKELEKVLGTTIAFLLDLDDVAQDEKERALLRKYRIAEDRDKRIAESVLTPTSRKQEGP